MKTELIERLRKLIYHCDEMGKTGTYVMQSELKQILQALTEQDQPKWIPIAESPKENGVYILYRPESDGQYFAYYWQEDNLEGRKGWMIDNEPVDIEEYSHYMPLSNSPKEL
jgi:hypothetical protein